MATPTLLLCAASAKAAALTALPDIPEPTSAHAGLSSEPSAPPVDSSGDAYTAISSGGYNESERSCGESFFGLGKRHMEKPPEFLLQMSSVGIWASFSASVQKHLLPSFYVDDDQDQARHRDELLAYFPKVTPGNVQAGPASPIIAGSPLAGVSSGTR
eukprot:TRINITY_DN22638_c0_g1_i1.p1 TRINITY_DN22638_c0_g1~~TRINITY_DN22638_c0_g1_i1.p1  ORF type:complete len:176 (-),score=29.41 TRINITY_DN22638_c0_g1_i1:231-704(-)